MSTRATKRIAGWASLQGLAMVGLATRLGFLHLGPHETELATIKESRQWVTEIPVERGKVFDKNGESNILALDLPVKNVCADPDVIVSSGLVGRVAASLAPMLNLPADELAVKLNRRGRHYACLQRALQVEASEEVASLSLPGIFFEDQTVRFYPQRDFLCHVLGFVNVEGYGSAGVELGMDKFLRGCKGFVEGEKDALQKEIYFMRGRYVAPVQGANVYLTIDQYSQYILEKALDSIGSGDAGGTVDGAWAIMQNVHTGEILAMASRPNFDLNGFRDASDLQKRNSTIGYVYEPGSTLKSITFAAALNEGLVTPDTVIDCENGKWMHSNRILRDYHAAGRLTVADGLKKSSNILTAKLAIKLGDQRLYDYMRAFGLGQRTGVELPAEEGGILRPLSDWSPISSSRMAIGQGVAVTALQMVSLYSAIANDGVLMRPYLVRQVRAADGTILYARQPEEAGRPIRPETAALMRRLLARVTEPDGTGKRAAIPGGPAIAGKTGTAQKPIKGGYSSTDYISSFVGFMPAEKPEVAIVVVIDNPQPVHTGGAVAAPIFQKIAAETARYMSMPAKEAASIAMR